MEHKDNGGTEMDTQQLAFDLYNKELHMAESSILVNTNNVTTNTSFEFQTIFTDKISFEEVHNHNSMAILGNCLDILKQIKNNSVHLIFADAPYNIGKNFGNNQDHWDTVEAYISWCKEWIDECMRVLKDNGTMYFMTATQHMPYLDIYATEKYHVLCRIVWTYDSSGVQSKKYLVLYMNLF